MSDSFTENFMEGGPRGGPEGRTQDKAAAGGSDGLEAQVIDVLKSVYDPEIPVNIYELGLIYDVKVDSANNVDVTMTLTTPMCPVADELPLEIEQKIRALGGVGEVKIDLVWEPPWDMSMLSDAAKLELGML